MKDKYIVSEDEHGVRLDLFLLRALAVLSRSKVQQLIRWGMVTLAGKSVLKPSQCVFCGQEYSILGMATAQKQRKPYSHALDIRYQDEGLVVLYKPAGLVVHPGIGNKDRTLVNALLHHYTQEQLSNAGSIRPGIVHRLDKDTEGFLIVAKTDHVHALLCEMIKNREVRRKYLAITHAVPGLTSGAIRTLIKRDRKKMVVSQHTGKSAITYYNVIAQSSDRKYSVIECTLETGRTHQIRVHMKSLGCPILGDKLYGLKKEADLIMEHHGLWAHSLQFTHPLTHEELKFYIEPTEIIYAFTEKLRCHSLSESTRNMGSPEIS
ncbi:pseudouridine synthase, RluA family protein [Neorickettsia helminthoeca str. Oregon]|uniref:Pseudouridine synthase n=1 Tax=Neorickettsia helminthoeca str. Oregon TaxID=1286528 RepID=X5GVM2_9RICK|nr:RluA family pseudouridine synthase [Neorickettsia helminthoeca]AHX11097.1 pseudouridine synthase, RluA family protein [Neorickettsia helminthoeca str. Oregon]